MKALIILAIILGIVFLFFGGGDKALPASIADVPGALWDKVKEIGNLINLESVFGSDIISGPAKSFVSETISKTIDKVSETAKTIIEDKLGDFFCPQK